MHEGLFPVDPSAAPEAAVRFVLRTLLRQEDRDPDDEDDYLARVIVVGVMAILADPATVEAGAVLVSEYTLATGDTVVIQPGVG